VPGTGTCPWACQPVCLQRPGRFSVIPKSWIQKSAVPAVPAPAESSSQSKTPLPDALLFEIVFDDDVLSAVIPVSSFCVALLCAISVPATSTKRKMPSSFSDVSLWLTSVPRCSLASAARIQTSYVTKTRNSSSFVEGAVFRRLCLPS